MKRNFLAAMTAVFLTFAFATGHAADKPAPDATIDLSGGSVAVGVGIDWSKGTLHYKGKDFPVKVKGISLLRVGASKISATGEVYNLKDVSQFSGNYSAVSAGAALAGGAGIAAMKNQNGVVMHLRSTTVGADLDLGVKGIEVTLDK